MIDLPKHMKEGLVGHLRDVKPLTDAEIKKICMTIFDPEEHRKIYSRYSDGEIARAESKENALKRVCRRLLNQVLMYRRKIQV